MKASYLDGRQVIVDGKKFHYFYGTSYLGLPYDSAFQKYHVEGQQKYGCSLGSSPLSTPQLDVYRHLENLLALRYGFEDALVFSSGYAAGQALISLYHDQDFFIEYGKVSHPALKLERNSTQLSEKVQSRKKVFAVDYIDPITFEKYDDGKLSNALEEIIIDVSHAMGLFDSDIKNLSKNTNVTLSGSLNKGFGINAGVLLCSSALKNKLIHSVRYKTASAPSPSECHALCRAFETDLIAMKQNELSSLIELLVTLNGVLMATNFPVMTFKDNSENLYNHFRDNKMLIWRNRYPTQESPMVNRAVITAAHTLHDVRALQDVLKEYIN